MGWRGIALAACALSLAGVQEAYSVGGGPVRGSGLTAIVPSGWHGRILRGALVASTGRLPPANRPLGPALHHRINPGEIGVLLFEDAPLWGVPFATSAYRSGSPRLFTMRDFGPPPLGGSNRGRHSFARRNFTVAGRYFDLFAESGSSRPSRLRLSELNELVASIDVEAGDFYPGSAPPARFQRAPGWTTRHTKIIPVGPSTYSISLASTVRYRDSLNEFPPHTTLEHLPAAGIVIWLSLSADNRSPPTVPQGDAGQPILRINPSACGLFEGAPPNVLTCRLEAWRRRQYHLFGWVILGRKHPSYAQKSRARAELARLVLPTWPPWPKAD